MTSFRSCVAYLAVVAGVLAASPASAQSGRVTASVNFGAQGSSGDFTQRMTPTIYHEPASIDIAQDYENGALVDIGAGVTLFGNYRRRPELLAHVRRWRGRGGRADSGPAVFRQAARRLGVGRRPRSLRERRPPTGLLSLRCVSPKMDISVGIGPTFFSVKQDLIDTVTVTEPTPTITPVVAEGERFAGWHQHRRRRHLLVHEDARRGRAAPVRGRLGRFRDAQRVGGESRCGWFSNCRWSASAFLSAASPFVV